MTLPMPKLNRNPFAQAASLWQLTFRVPMEAVIAMEELFDGMALATSSFEDAAQPEFWQVQVIFDHAPDAENVKNLLSPVVEQLSISLPELLIEAVHQEQWQRSLAEDFPPLSLGRFFVHGAHAKAEKPMHMHSLQVEAGMAFGSGEHATTSGCLLAMQQLAKRRTFSNVLDMGCGSAILAVASARLWRRAPVLAVDIDEVSVRIARENVRLNRVRGNVRAIAGDGYAAREVALAAPYDLILANILARPLVKFSPALARNLAPGGVAVLSGLLASQEAMVLSAHRRQGLFLTHRIIKDGWATLVLHK